MTTRPDPPRNWLGRFADGFLGHRAFFLAGAFCHLGLGLTLAALLTGDLSGGSDLALALGAVSTGTVAILGGATWADGKKAELETRNGPRPVFGDTTPEGDDT